MRALAAAALAAAFALSGCAVPQIDRFMLQQERAAPRLEGASGPLSREQSERILADLKRRSPESGVLERHVAVEEAIAGNPLTIGNRATLLQDGPQTYAAMLQAIRAARHHVHLEFYIFDDDEIGRQFAEALLERRRAGVQVRVIVDAVGSMKTPKEFFERLASQGVEVAVFNPINPGTVLTQGLMLQRRDHRKLVVTDGRVAFLGGINISGVYSPYGSGGSGPSQGEKGKDERPWRDTQVRIEGPVVEDLQRSFLAMWGRLHKQPPLEDRAFYPGLSRVGNHLVRAVEGSPDRGANALYVALISAVQNAEASVRITMAYFVPHDALLGALEDAARRGVRVEILLPSKSDNWLVLSAGRSYYDELLEAGVRLYERRDRVLHSKTASVDGVWSTVGSTNLDWRSLAYNDELNAVVLSPEFAAQLDAAFARDLAQSDEITREAWADRPAADRLRESIARAWALLL